MLNVKSVMLREGTNHLNTKVVRRLIVIRMNIKNSLRINSVRPVML